MGEGSTQVCWVVTGPTASGKTAVVLELAARHEVEVVSVDSMQLYRGMDVGTAKPTAQELARVPHHLVDVLAPGDACNVARYCRMALDAIGGIRARGRRPLLVGGSPMYLKGLLYGIMDAPAGDPALRRELQEQAERRGPADLHRELAAADPAAAERIHPNDVQRLVRALEVHRLTGQAISAGQQQFAGLPRLAHAIVGLALPRGVLRERIDRRVDAMMAAGLLEEVRGLQGRLGPQARQALGYKELAAFLEGRVPLDEAVRLIKRNTRRYARHQVTWFRHFPDLRWVNVADCLTAGQAADRCEAALEGSP